MFIELVIGLEGYEDDVGARAQGDLGINLASTDARGLGSARK